jgi:hypothetical protein
MERMILAWSDTKNKIIEFEKWSVMWLGLAEVKKDLFSFKQAGPSWNMKVKTADAFLKYRQKLV